MKLLTWFFSVFLVGVALATIQVAEDSSRESGTTVKIPRIDKIEQDIYELTVSFLFVYCCCAWSRVVFFFVIHQLTWQEA